MLRINCLDGSPVRNVKMTVQVEMTFAVGGADDEDRMDAVRMAFEDHYVETVNQSFWRDAITGMFVSDVKIDEEVSPKEELK